MKKTAIIVLLALIPFIGSAGTLAEEISKSKVSSIVSEVKSTPGAEVVQLGGLLTSIIKNSIRLSASMSNDEDVRNALNVIKKVKGISVVDFEDCSAASRNRINNIICKALEGMDVLMEVKDDDEVLRMYGVMDEKKGVVRDFILYSPEECALICLFGSISIDALSGMIND